MNIVFTRNPNGPASPEETAFLTQTEWLVTNGLGGYATGTISGALTRVFHGYLISALQAPLGRTMMLNDVLEELVFPDGQVFPLNALFREDLAGVEVHDRARHLSRFALDHGLPVWTFELNGISLEKRLIMPHRQNTTYVGYHMTAGSGRAKLRLRPVVNMRQHEAPVNTPLESYTFSVRDSQYELKSQRDIPTLRMKLLGQASAFAIDTQVIPGALYEVERSRGYTFLGDLWSPGYFTVDVDASSWATLVVSTDSWEMMSALQPHEAWDAEVERKHRLALEADPRACNQQCHELVWAADQFIFTPVGRPADTARARAAGDEIRSVIAGYHWFTDWGRDTMISLEGLTLTTGREVESNYILRTFAHYIRDGLIPNMFPEGETSGLYHTADATLWFFHAFSRYMQYTHDHQLLNHILPKLLEIVGYHLRGTLFNIHVDPADGLLIQGKEGCQLTWMDAKVDDWVVTPRRGKAVEINALWYNALRLLEGFLRDSDRAGDADGIAKHAAKAKESFNRRFWNEEAGFLFDVVDGEDPAADRYCRPNQIFAISLDYPVLDESRWQPVLQVVKDRLLTPVGLRSLAPGERDYKAKYDGDLRSRDAAYHQGTVWAWLIGPFVDAWLRVHPRDYSTARGFLHGLEDHLSSACVGSISEIFDAEPPFTPRGCCAQAWSVAEVLRCVVKSSGVEDIPRESREFATAAVE